VIERIRKALDHARGRIAPLSNPVPVQRAPTDLARVYAGRSGGRTQCSSCGAVIPKGAVEYEIITGAARLLSIAAALCSGSINVPQVAEEGVLCARRVTGVGKCEERDCCRRQRQRPGGDRRATQCREIAVCS